MEGQPFLKTGSDIFSVFRNDDMFVKSSLEQHGRTYINESSWCNEDIMGFLPNNILLRYKDEGLNVELQRPIPRFVFKFFEVY